MKLKTPEEIAELAKRSAGGVADAIRADRLATAEALEAQGAECDARGLRISGGELRHAAAQIRRSL